MKLYFETPINLPYEKVRDRFNKDLFLQLTPAFIPSSLERYDGNKKGDEVHVAVGPAAFRQPWVSVITSEGTTERGWSFIDEGKVLPWPLTYWKHHHRVDILSPNQCKIVDDIHYECSLKIFSYLLKPLMWSVFSIRPERYQQFFKD